MQKFKKLIVSGHVIEVYEYKKSPVTFERNDFDDYNPFDLDNTKLEPREDRKHERREQTVRDARNDVRRLALMNFGPGDKFITLTFDPKKFKEEQLRDVEFVDKEFNKFIKRFKYHFKCPDLKYIAVREFHKTGRLHFHMICDWKKNLLFEDEIREYERMIGERVWKNGFVDIKQMDMVDNIGAYIVKYMTKDVSVYFFKGRKIYLCSKGLKRPIIYRDFNADLVISSYGLDTKKEVYTNSYNSEYLGKITYKEYNLKRL